MADSKMIQWALSNGYKPEDVSTTEALTALRERYEAETKGSTEGSSKPPKVAEVCYTLLEGDTVLATFVQTGEVKRGRGQGVRETLETQAMLWAAQNGFNFAELKRAVASTEFLSE